MKSLLTILFILVLNTISYSQQKGFYRTPAIHDNWIAFTAEGDLWKYNLSTSQSMRLTSHQGLEFEPMFSPDGKWIVFTGEYDGAPELYVLSAEGGIPKRITYENWRGIKAVQWLADGRILYTTRSQSALDDNQLVKINPQNLDTEMVPLSQAADGDIDANGTLFFTRLAFQGSHTKRYQGGTAQNIWSFSGKGPSTCLTCDFKGTSREVFLYKDRIYFASDRDGTMNIWSMNKEGKDIKQHTASSGWDLLSPSGHRSKMVYQKGADLAVLDLETNQEQILDIRIQSDFDQRRPRWIKDPEEKISYWDISPGGKFVALIARGRVFVSPANGSRWVEVTRKSGIRYNAVAFLDENNLAYLSDESGEVEIWKVAANGSGTPQQLTRNSKVLITEISASPDGKFIAYTDKDYTLNVLTIATGVVKRVEQNEYTAINSLAWSKDSKYFTYASDEANAATVIKVYDPVSGVNQKVTTERLTSYEGQFSFDRKWFYFISDREFKSKVGSPWGPRQPEPYYDKTSKLYALALDPQATFPFAQSDGWVEKKKEEDKEEVKEAKSTKKKEEAKPASVTPIDWKTATRGLYELPLTGRNILRIRIAENYLYWTEIEGQNYSERKLYSLKLEYNKKTEPTLVAEDIRGFDLSSDRTKLVVKKGNTLYLSEPNGEKLDLEKTKLDLSGWSFQLNPVEDWKQMFVDAWRLERDYFYDKNLHGVDWPAVRKRYEPLVERVTDRYELDQLISQMVAELSALHTFVYGGDKRKSPDNILIGSLGARLTKDPAGKGYRITHIYLNDRDYPAGLSPLHAPNLKIKEGDVITKINDAPASEPDHMNHLLLGKVGVWVKLTLQNSKGETYDQLVKPISQDEEVSLRCAEWEYTRRLEVEQKSSSKFGYIHLRAMSTDDMDDFVEQYYPIFNRDGLILDVRHNGGGNIDSWILEKLMRKAWFYWQPRVGKPYWNMHYAFRGHIVVLCDENTGSDGEAVTEGIRRLKLGTIMGTRTWGGEIWLTSSNTLVDDGIATAAEFGVFADGQWLIEGHGVDPDIVVDNEPYETFQGKDAQLDAAIQFLQDKLVKEPIPTPQPPAYPNKSFQYKP
ncbi:MAG TPA: S41 family peptidase [Cyclobacteriaceae bacterium]|nr:S41 family peptidase [Cyclobacteriaceae bacterium]